MIKTRIAIVVLLSILFTVFAVVSACSESATPEAVGTLTIGSSPEVVTPGGELPHTTGVPLLDPEPLNRDLFEFFANENYVIVTGPKFLAKSVITQVQESEVTIGRSFYLNQQEEHNRKTIQDFCPLIVDENGSARPVVFRNLPELTLVYSISLPYLGTLIGDNADSCSGLPQQELMALDGIDYDGQEPWVMAVYEIGPIPDFPLKSAQPDYVTSAINCLSVNSGYPVLADPVYYVGNRPELDPYIGTGSPYIGTGSPWFSGASPYIGTGSPGGIPVLTDKHFLNQPAFIDPSGIELYVGNERTYDGTGEGVRVGVFDTSPFDDPGQTTVENLTPELVLEVEDHEQFINQDTLPAEYIESHGLFVSGLINAVAPGSEIHLYRVLDENGQGDLWTLNTALADFIQNVLKDGPENGAVINLSMGSRTPFTIVWLSPNIHWAQDLRDTKTLINEITSLHTLLAAASCYNIAIVAAAGNDSYEIVNAISPAQLPSLFDEIISVGASNRDRDRSCYSNKAQVAAPGGDGFHLESAAVVGSVPGGELKLTCRPQSEECIVNDDCVDAVIGPVLLPGGDEAVYAYWVGTSFSTPMVSGLAALLLEEDSDRSPAELLGLMKGIPHEESGDWPDKPPPTIINVRETFSP